MPSPPATPHPHVQGRRQHVQGRPHVRAQHAHWPGHTVWNHLQYSSPAHPGRPAAHPTATGWDEELRARTAGVRLPRPGHSV